MKKSSQANAATTPDAYLESLTGWQHSLVQTLRSNPRQASNRADFSFRNSPKNIAKCVELLRFPKSQNRTPSIDNDL